MIPSERNETTGTWERSSRVTRDEWDARDIFTAAWLHANGLQFLRCFLYKGWTRWVFADREAAWELNACWRNGGPDAMVHGPTYMLSWKQMQVAARAVGFTQQTTSSGRFEQE